MNQGHKKQYKEVDVSGMQPLLLASENIPIHRHILMF